jgi:hypothetical protein
VIIIFMMAELAIRDRNILSFINYLLSSPNGLNFFYDGIQLFKNRNGSMPFRINLFVNSRTFSITEGSLLSSIVGEKLTSNIYFSILVDDHRFKTLTKNCILDYYRS